MLIITENIVISKMISAIRPDKSPEIAKMKSAPKTARLREDIIKPKLAFVIC